MGNNVRGQKVEKNTYERQLQFELLRIIAMLMVVTLHCLGKGGLLTDSHDATFTLNGYIAWLIEAFCLVAVNVYVMISGYFGTYALDGAHDGKKLIRRVLGVWKKVFFYSVFIALICFALKYAGVIPGELYGEADIYRVFCYLFPISTEHYWFATSYILLCLIAPFIDIGFEKMNKKEASYILLFMLLFFSVSKTVIPMKLPWDNYGYDVCWFAVLYITGKYIRAYGFPYISSRAGGLCLYALSGLMVFAVFVIFRGIYIRTGALYTLTDYTYSYNHLFCYLGAAGLFSAFSLMDMHSIKDSLKRAILRISRATFGVYLIHEHMDLRILWPVFMGSEMLGGGAVVFVVKIISAVFIVYAVCTLADIAVTLIMDKIAGFKKNR